MEATPMYVLGIETSCDETAAAVVQNGKKICSNTLLSSLKEHKRYGGIIPEIASRRQLESIQTVVSISLANARLKLGQIDSIAVTQSPGLIGSLLVGLSFARSLSFAANKPLVEVDHIKSHLYANVLNRKSGPKLPAVGLVISGGHTSLYLIKTWQSFRLIGQTRDDAVGETFDKVSRILDLGYPGGPAIDRMAVRGKNSHIQFTCAPLSDTLDFSFSGIKTAVLYYSQDQKKKIKTSKAQIAYSFQKSVVDCLIKKCLAACRKNKVKTLLIGGGVAANSYLRDRLKYVCGKERLKLYYPPLSLCTDNAAMIAGFGYQQMATLKNKSRRLSAK